MPGIVKGLHTQLSGIGILMLKSGVEATHRENRYNRVVFRIEHEQGKVPEFQSLGQRLRVLYPVYLGLWI